MSVLLPFARKNFHVHVEWRTCLAPSELEAKGSLRQFKGLHTHLQTVLAKKEMLRSKEYERMTVCTQTGNECGAVFV